MTSVFTLKFTKSSNPSKEVYVPIDRDQFNHLVTWKEFHDERTLDRMFAAIIYRYEESEGIPPNFLDAYDFKGIFVGSEKQD